jgi:hypothetical protein
MKTTVVKATVTASFQASMLLSKAAAGSDGEERAK